MPSGAGRGSRGCSPASRASTRTRARSPTSTRTCSAKARSSARASTTSTRSTRRSAAGFPENRILSHDLLEGAYARAGLVSDVMLFEDYPSRYAADVSRRHRWIRGDWQIARVAARPRARRPDGRRAKQPDLAAVALEDPRQPAAQPRAGRADCCLLLAGVDRPGRRWFATLVVAGILLLPGLLTRSATCCRPTEDLPPRHHTRRLRRRAASCVAAFDARFLPYDAYLSLDAIVRTGVRRAVTHPASCWNGRRRATPSGSGARQSGRPYRAMWVAPAIAAGAGGGWPPGRRRCCGPPPADRAAGSCRPGRLVDQPARLRPTRPKLTPIRRCLPRTTARARPGGSSRRSSAPRTTGCRPTTSRRIRRRGSRTARRRPTSGCRCWRTWPRTTSATSRPAR